MNLKEYKENYNEDSCPECGKCFNTDGVSITYIPERTRYTYSGFFRKDKATTIEKHLEIKCNHCGYLWKTVCKGKEVKDTRQKWVDYTTTDAIDCKKCGKRLNTLLNPKIKTKYESESYYWTIRTRECLQRECLHCGYTWKEMCKHEGTGE